MNDEQIDYKQLRKIQQAEKSSPILTKIDDHLFTEASSYCSTLHHRLEHEEKPSRKLIISDQIQQIDKIIRGIYELREKKIINAAMAKARGGNPSEKLLLESEKQLFSAVHSLLITHRDITLQPKEIHTSHTHKNETSKQNNKEPSKKTTEFTQNTEEKKPIKQDHTVVRIVETIPTFIGTDTKKYDLKKRDIISLPKDLASMLIKKKVAEIVPFHN